MGSLARARDRVHHRTTTVLVAVHWRRPRVPLGFVPRIVRAALASQRSMLRLSVALVGDREIRKLNRRFLGHDYVTDVIAFPLAGSGAGDNIDGEVVVSLECAVREGEGREHGWRAELALYLVHGVLHLCGHDDHDPAGRRRMIRAERDVLASLGYEVSDRI